MKDSHEGWGIFLMVLGVAVMGILTGWSVGSQVTEAGMRKEAVKAGAAEWVLVDEGKPRQFRYKTCGEVK